MNIKNNIDFPHSIMKEDCTPYYIKKSNISSFKKLFGENGIEEKCEKYKCKTIIYDALDIFIRISKIYKCESIKKSILYNILNNDFLNGCKKIYLIFDKKKDLKSKFEYIIKQREYDKIEKTMDIKNKENDINKFITFLKNVNNKHINFNVVFIELNYRKVTILQNNYYEEKMNINNHIEADTNIWYIINDLSEKEVLIRCSDTDIIFIGLLLYNKLIYKNIKIIIETKHKSNNKEIYKTYYINNIYNNIESIFKNKVKYSIINFIIIYVLSGCDYVSPIYKICKNDFIETYKKYINNIGDLVYSYKYNIINLNIDSCLKLIGLCYISKYKKKGYYFNDNLINKNGREIVKYLRQVMIKNINNTNKNEYFIKNLISDEKSLYYHILRTKYVINIWNQSLKNTINYSNPEYYGWIKNGKNIYICKYHIS